MQRTPRQGHQGNLRRDAAAHSSAAGPRTPSPLSNYAPDAGHGSQNLSCSATWRAALLGTVAGGALLLGYGRSAKAGPDPCVVAGTTLTCTGNQSAGASYGAPYTVLNVNSLTTNIAPAAGVTGISFSSAGAITLNSDIGPYSIVTTGGAHGIYAYGGGGVTIDHTGTIDATAGYGGILASNFTGNAVDVTSSGDISAGLNAIYARSSTGTVTVDSTGDLVSVNRRGIQVYSFGSSAVSVTSDGTITARYSGISTYNRFGTTEVTSTGDIASTYGPAIYARSFTGAVTVDSTGDISLTFGPAIFARSVTGAVTVDSTGDLTSTYGGGIYARNYGSAAAVEVTSVGGVNGIQAPGIGILADSFGGGAVTVDSTGDVTSQYSYGMIVRSFGGGGAVSVTNNGAIDARYAGIYGHSDFGTLTIDSTGDVTSTNTYGIRANYSPSADITLHSGTVMGGIAGVQFNGGTTNTLTNYAAISGGSFAVRGTYGNETIDNYGLITGNVALGSGLNAFNNRSGGTFASGSTAYIGAGNTLTNEGDLTPGGVGTVQTTALTGNLVQTGTGTFTVDVDEGGAGADVVTITGTADFAGTVAPNVINLTSPSGSILIADASGGLTSTATAVDTPTVDFGLSVIGTQLFLTWQPGTLLNLITGPMTPNQEATATYLDALNAAGPSAALQALIDAVKGLPDEAAILAALDRLHPEHYLAHVNDTLHSSQAFLSSLMSCPQADGGFVLEGQCYWAKVGARGTDWDRDRTNIGGDAEAWSVSGGVQVALEGNWRLGAALAYEDVDISTSNAARSDGDRVEGGVIVKNRWGDTSLAAAAFAGYGWFDTERAIGLAGIGRAHGEHDVAFGGIAARLAHTFDQGGWYLRPLVDLNATYLDFGDVRETGGGAANLNIRGESEWVLSATPALELGGEMAIGNGLIARPFVRAGVMVIDDANFALTSSFLGAPAGVGPFTVTSNFDEVLLDVSAGLDVVSLDGVNLKLSYDGRFSEDSEMHAGGVKVGVKF